MKLNLQEIKKLHNVLQTCSVGGIDAVVIGDGFVRGVNESSSCLIISDSDVPAFGDYKVGLNRLSALKSRLDLFMDGDDVSIDAKESDRGEITQLEISQKRNKTQFRCSATAMIKAPKSVNDEGLHQVTISKDQLQLVLNAARVMSAKKLVLAIKADSSVSIQASDANNDNFVVALDTPAELVGDGEPDSVAHYFPSDVFASILKAALASESSVSLIIGVSGTITVSVNNHTMIILPQVGDE